MKERIDVVLVKKGFFPSRERAKTAVMAGQVFVDGAIFDKPGMTVDHDAEIVVKGSDCPYVSRGGLKLEKALDFFGISPEGAVCLDIGASTGGFTDCLLQRGASKVFSVDVGYGQLDYRLRTDPRVVNIEKCNFRYMDSELIPDPIDFFCCDVSFISLGLIIPAAVPLLAERAGGVVLIKPQFEAGREQVGKKGIVRDPAVHRKVIEKVLGIAVSHGLVPSGLTYSPVTGAKGNIEYLLHLNKGGNVVYNIPEERMREVVDEAHAELGR